VFKKFVAPVVIAGVLLGGATAATAGVASAASPTTASAPAGHHALKSWIRAHRRQIRQAALAVSAKSIGISPQALRAELKSGKSVVQVAGEHGVAAQTVIGALVAAADARIDQAVTNHKLSSDLATKIKDALPARVAKAVNHVF
jgi:urease alpha subunit